MYDVFISLFIGLLMQVLGGYSITRIPTSHFVLVQIFPVEQHVMAILFLQGLLYINRRGHLLQG